MTPCLTQSCLVRSRPLSTGRRLSGKLAYVLRSAFFDAAWQPWFTWLLCPPCAVHPVLAPKLASGRRHWYVLTVSVCSHPRLHALTVLWHNQPWHRTAYVISLYVMTEWMKGRERFKLVLVTRYHNLLLCLWSLVMCLGASYVIFDAVVNKGYTFIDLVCDTKYGKAALMSGPLGFWAWSYYVSKVLFACAFPYSTDANADSTLCCGATSSSTSSSTLFFRYDLRSVGVPRWLCRLACSPGFGQQILKKKPLTVLHVYHHICMVLTTWIWCSDKLTMHWYAIIVNCTCAGCGAVRLSCLPDFPML